MPLSRIGSACRRRELRLSVHFEVTEGVLSPKQKARQMMGALSCRPISGRFAITSFPLDVGHLEQGYVIFEANSVEVIKRQIAFHGLAKILHGRIKIGEYRCLHDSLDPLLPILPILSVISIGILRVFCTFWLTGATLDSLVLHIHHAEINWAYATPCSARGLSPSSRLHTRRVCLSAF